MPVEKIFRIDKLQFSSGSVDFEAIANARWNFNIETLTARGPGELQPNFRATQKQRPRINFSTPQLDLLLGSGGLACGIQGVAFSDCDTYYKAGATVGNTARASLAHRVISAAEGIVYWNEIRLPNRGQASADVIVAANYDGVNEPWTHTASQALSGNITPVDYFLCGPVSINGTSIPSVQEVTISSGIRLLELDADGEVYDTFTAIEMNDPVITIRTLDVTNWDDLGLNGLALNGSTGLVGYMRKYAANGARVANATTEHISYTALNGRAIPVDDSGNEAGPITSTLRVETAVVTTASTPLAVTFSDGVAIS